jgi:hypothetical protein
MEFRFDTLIIAYRDKKVVVSLCVFVWFLDTKKILNELLVVSSHELEAKILRPITMI